MHSPNLHTTPIKFLPTDSKLAKAMKFKAELQHENIKFTNLELEVICKTLKKAVIVSHS